MIAISTAWNAERHAGWLPAVGELLAMGQPAVALDGAALHGDAPAVRRHLKHEGGDLTALFAPAPLAQPGPGQPLGLIDPDGARRQVAIARAAAAARCGIAAGTAHVVIRVGAVPTLDPREEERILRARLTGEVSGQAPGGLSVASAPAASSPAASLAPRERYLDALCRALHALDAAVPDARWLLETPRTGGGFPRPAELVAVCDELPRASIGYWHDAGYAARLAALGIAQQGEWLDQAGPRAEGVTIADWSPLAERLPPGSGEVEWSALRTQIGATMRRVLTLDPAIPAPMVRDAAGEAVSLGF